MNYKDIKQWVREHPEGRYRCPVCGGGSTREKSFSIYNTDTIRIGICFRGKCGIRCVVGNTEKDKKSEKPLPDEKILSWNSEYQSIHKKYFDKYSLTNPEKFFKVPTQIGDFVIPPEKRYRLILILPRITKGIIKNIYPHKPLYLYANGGLNPLIINKTYNVGSFKRGAWFDNNSLYKLCTTVVVTEDAISACRVNQDTGLPAVALCGTNLYEECLTKLAKYSQVVLCLDPDEAGIKGAVRIMKGHLAAMTKVNVELLRADPKDLSIQELKDALAKWM